MKEIFDDIARNENIPLQIVKPSSVDQLIIDHHQPSHGFLSSSLSKEADDGFEDELSDLHQEKMRNKIQELNAQFAADPTPVESSRQRHVTFKENLVDIMDSISPRHTPDLLGDEDINEKSLEEIQMLSQKSFLGDSSTATGGTNDECKSFENSHAEEECETEYPSVNKTESVGVELGEANLENMKNDSNENEDAKHETCDENDGIDRSESSDEDECHSTDSEEMSHSEQQTQENESSNLPQEKVTSSTEMILPLDENAENKNEEINSIEDNNHHTNVEESENEHISCIKADDEDINELNLCFDANCEDTEEETNYNLQSHLTSNADELLADKTAETNQNDTCPESLNENTTQNIEQVLNEYCSDEKKTENLEQTLNSELEMNSNISDHEILEHHTSQFINIDDLTKKVTPSQGSVENDHVSTDGTKSEGKLTTALEQASKLEEDSIRKIASSNDKYFVSAPAVTKTNKPNVNSKSKASSKLKPAKNMENQSYKRLPNYKGNPRSQYGLSKEECKDLMTVRKEKILEMKRKEKEEEENRIQKQEEARKAFQAWLSKKKMQEKNKDKKPTKVAATLKEVPTKEENKKPYGDAEEAFQAWLKRKEQQISREEILKQLEEEEKALAQCRVSRSEATKAFNKWLAKKHREENELGRRAAPRGNYLNTLPLQPRHIEAFAQTFHAYLGNTM